MPRQPNRSDVIRALVAAGFVFTPGRGRSGHDKWQLVPHVVAVPRHREDIRPGTFANIRRQAGGWSTAKFWWYANGMRGPEPD